MIWERHLKLSSLKSMTSLGNKIEYGERRLIERDLGMHIEGEADVRNPERVFGIVPLGGRWYFGHYVESEPVWYHHIKTA